MICRLLVGLESIANLLSMNWLNLEGETVSPPSLTWENEVFWREPGASSNWMFTPVSETASGFGTAAFFSRSAMGERSLTYVVSSTLY